MKQRSHAGIVRITAAGVFMAMNIALSSFGVPVPGGHLYLNDIVICLASILLGPFEAFAVGGIGAFIGDMLFYPTPMWVSLVTHGLQGVAISLCTRHLWKKHPAVASGLGVTVGAVIMVAGYSVGRAYLYGTPAYAVAKLPFQILQAVTGAVVGMLLAYPLGLRKAYQKIIGK